jgi:hypothetical protein
MSLWIKGATF